MDEYNENEVKSGNKYFFSGLWLGLWSENRTVKTSSNMTNILFRYFLQPNNLITICDIISINMSLFLLNFAKNDEVQLIEKN
jgi:hypothetical protein